MNYLKTAALVLTFVFPMAFVSAQEAVTTSVDDAPVPALISEEGADVEVTSHEEEVMVDEEGAEGEEGSSNVWYWVIGILVLIVLAWFFTKKGKDDSMDVGGSEPASEPEVESESQQGGV